MIFRQASMFQTAGVRDVHLRRNADTRSDEAEDRWAAVVPICHISKGLQYCSLDIQRVGPIFIDDLRGCAAILEP